MRPKKARPGQFVKGGRQRERHQGKASAATSRSFVASAEPAADVVESLAELGAEPQKHQQVGVSACAPHQQGLLMQEKVDRDSLEAKVAELQSQLADQKEVSAHLRRKLIELIQFSEASDRIPTLSHIAWALRAELGAFLARGGNIKNAALKLSNSIDHELPSWLAAARAAAPLTMHLLSELTGLTINAEPPVPPLEEKKKDALVLDTALAAMHIMRGIDPKLQTYFGWHMQDQSRKTARSAAALAATTARIVPGAPSQNVLMRYIERVGPNTDMMHVPRANDTNSDDQGCASE